MALIPSDVGIRMRMQADASLLQPVAPVHEIAADLPDLQPGQAFSARIQEVLPDNSYRALVAGKQLTLQLPEGAKPGDTLDLIVVDRTTKSVIAKLAEVSVDTKAAASEPYPFSKFSPAARLIGQLLPAEGEQVSTPTALNRGQPLLAAPPLGQNAASQLAQTLASAVTQSGMFYEAHQAQWVAGKLPLAELLIEPQGRHSAPEALDHAIAEIHSRMQQAGHTGGAAPEKVGPSVTAAPVPETSHAAPAPSTAPQVAEEIRPLVQQQLESFAAQRMAWHGEVWPQQALDWAIDWEGDREGDGSEEEGLRWSTTLALTTPRLGHVAARLHLTHEGVHVLLTTPYGASAADLRDESPKLNSALEAAGVPMLSFHVRYESEPAAEAPRE